MDLTFKENLQRALRICPPSQDRGFEYNGICYSMTYGRAEEDCLGFEASGYNIAAIHITRQKQGSSQEEAICVQTYANKGEDLAPENLSTWLSILEHSQQTE